MSFHKKETEKNWVSDQTWMLLTGGWSSATAAQPPSLLPLQFFSISIPIKRGETNWSEPIFEKVYETEKLKKEPFFTLCWQSGRKHAMICCWTQIFLTAKKRLIQQCDKQSQNRIRLSFWAVVAGGGIFTFKVVMKNLNKQTLSHPPTRHLSNNSRRDITRKI